MSAQNTETTEMIIEGANCPFCLNDTLEKLRTQPGVVDAHLSATDHCVRVEYEGPWRPAGGRRIVRRPRR